MENIFQIAVCDSDEGFIDLLKSRILEVTTDNKCRCKVTEVYDGIELIRYCQKNIVDAVLTEIDVPKMNGFDAVKEIKMYQPNLLVIFVTEHEEYAFRAYDYQPFWFVSKAQLKKIDQILDKLIKQIQSQKEKEEIIRVKLDRIIELNVNEILYFKSDRHYLSAYSVNGNVFTCRCSMKHAYEQLAKVGYIRVQRSYLVNYRFIEKFNRQFILLKNKQEISVTRNYAMWCEARQLYGNCMRNEKG